MNIKTIYLINGLTDYSASTPVQAFTDKTLAEAFVITLEEYHKTMPRYNQGMNPVNFAEYLIQRKEWLSKHPVYNKENPNHSTNVSFCDDFEIVTIQLIETELKNIYLLV